MVENLPEKLKADSIVEVVLEIRFEPDASLMPEIIFGRFADTEEWRAFRQARLPTADIPAPIRRADPNLRYQPSIELFSPDGSMSVRIGPQSIGYIRRGAYPGWEKFGAELHKVVALLYKVVPGAQVSRIGLRYVNALTTNVHGINTLADMDISVAVAGAKLSTGLNVNFKLPMGKDSEAMTRIATVDMAEGVIPDHASVIVDIDVYTLPGYSEKKSETVSEWIERAHNEEKTRFFNVLGKAATERLRADR